MLGTFDLTNCFYLVTVISTFDTASCVICVIFLSAVALLVYDNGFHSSNSLSWGVMLSLCMYGHACSGSLLAGLRWGFNFCFSGGFCWWWRGDWALGYHSMGFRHFADKS